MRNRVAKLFIEFLRDERGFDPITLGAIAVGGGSLLGGLLGKKKQTVYDPYSALRGKWQDYMVNKIGTSTPYEYNSEFEIPQPEVEKAAESAILGKIQNPETAQSWNKDVTDKYYQSRKALMGESFDEERKKTKDMYNRLGLVSSTPGLEAEAQVNKSQRLAEDDLSASLMYEDIARELEAKKTAENINQGYLNQGLTLGSQQREYSKFPIQMSMADIERMVQEEQNYASMAAGVLGGNPPQVSYTPNFWAQLGQMGQDIGGTLISGGLAQGGSSGGISDEELQQLLSVLGRK